MTVIAQTGNPFVDGTFETIENADGNLRQLHYISGGDGLFAIYVIDQDGKATMNYIHTDYQGSFETITDNQGLVVEKLSYDPWGRRRNPTNWTFTDIPESYTFDRGYTGHEHLDVFGLINMNGRMYDPLLGRFLSPDNYVQAPDYTQNFNRYSYVLNNPLKYTDPSGEFWNFVIGAAIGGVVGYISGRAAGLRGKDLTFYTIGSAVIGAMSAGVGTGVSSAVNVGASGFISSGISGGVGGFAGGFIGGAGMTGLNNTVFGQSKNILLGGIIGAGIGAGIGGILGGIQGGVADVKEGGGFFRGMNGGSDNEVYIYPKGNKYGTVSKRQFDVLTEKVVKGTASDWELREWARIYKRITINLGKYTNNSASINLDFDPKYFKDNYKILFRGALASRNQQLQFIVNGEQTFTSVPTSDMVWQNVIVNKVESMNISIIGPHFDANAVLEGSINIVNVVPDLDLRIIGYRYF